MYKSFCSLAASVRHLLDCTLMSVCTWCHLWNQSSLQSLSASASACTKLPCSRCLGILGGLSLNRRRSSYSTYNGECRSNMPIVNFARPQSTNTYCFKFLIWKMVPVLFIGCPDKDTFALAGNTASTATA